MREFTKRFAVNGKPMLAPDADVAVRYTDLEADSGRDAGCFLHRVVARYHVGTWSFSYAHLTEPERRYLESLFADAPDFDFTHPDRLDAHRSVTTRAYRSGSGLRWHDARTGCWKGCRFEITEC